MSSREALFTDRAHLSTQAYGTSANLNDRVAIYHYQQQPINLVRQALEQVQWTHVANVLDVGCGPGPYLRHLAQHTGARLAGVDLSRGMLADLVRQWPGAAPLPALAVADAQALPFADARQDVVLAMHMLYHVPDIAAAARELRRVLRPGGTLLAVTNGEEHMGAVMHTLDQAIAAVAGRAVAQSLRFGFGDRFSLQNGAAQLETAFRQVRRVDFRGELAIPEAGPVVRYLNSTRHSYQDILPPGVAWDAVLHAAEQIVTENIAAHGVFRVQTATGVFVCQ